MDTPTPSSDGLPEASTERELPLPEDLKSLVAEMRRLLQFVSLDYTRRKLSSVVPDELREPGRESELQKLLDAQSSSTLDVIARALSIPFIQELLTHVMSHVGQLERGAMPTLKPRVESDGKRRLYTTEDTQCAASETLDKTIFDVYVRISFFLSKFSSSLHTNATERSDPNYHLLSQVVKTLSSRNYFRSDKIQSGRNFIDMGTVTVRLLVAGLLQVIPSVYEKREQRPLDPSTFEAIAEDDAFYMLFQRMSEMEVSGFVEMTDLFKSGEILHNLLGSKLDILKPECFVLEENQLKVAPEVIHKIHTYVREKAVESQQVITYCPARYTPKQMKEFVKWMIDVFVRYAKENL